MNKTIRELIATTNLDKIETKVLLRHALNLSPSELIMVNDKLLKEEELNKFNQLLQKRLLGIPIHYILGYKEFYSRDFQVTADTLIPRPETELLIDEVLKIASPQNKILDLGTGTGCIAITCKLELLSLDITAVDKFKNTLNVARSNATNLNAEIDFIESDWYECVTGKFNIIISNPPYIEKNDPYLLDLQYEPQHALTDFDNGLKHYEKIISRAPNYLSNNGHLVLEHGYMQKNAITKILQDNGFKSIRTIQDYANLDRITIAQI